MKKVIFTNTVAFVSTLKVEDLQKIQKFREEALNLYDDKDNKTFEYRWSNCSGGLTANAVWFNEVTDDGYAMVKMPVCGENADEKKNCVAEFYGAAIVKAEEIEAGLGEVIEHINSELTAIKNKVTVAL